MSEPVISPLGDAIAVVVRNKLGRRQLAVMDTADLTKATIAVSFNDVDVVEPRWADDRRLVFSIWREDESAEEQVGSGLYGVDRDGGNLRLLISPNWNHLPTTTGTAITSRALTPNHTLLRTLTDGSADVIVMYWSLTQAVGIENRWHIDIAGTTPLRLDTRTGRTSDVVLGRKPGYVYDWLVDGNGKLRAAMSDHEGESTVFIPEGNDWATRAHFPSLGDPATAYQLHSVAPDGSILVRHALPGLDGASALFKLNPATGQPESEPLVSLKGFDFHGDLVADEAHHRLLGIHYLSDAAGTVWFDASMKALQQKVDARLPGLINNIDPAPCGCAPRVLVTSHSDRSPPTYFLYDRNDDTLIPIGSARPRIQPQQMAETDFFRIKARDGHDLPVYVTRPHGKGPWPAVVLVHGGPQVRGWTWQWDEESQFLASRGYLVVKPEFRGSKGYGQALFTSGFKQWGLASQDDIADATRWAAAQGLADPRRICIAGGSYGGYATLMGLVRYGELYRCGIAYAAVTDIALMYDIWWSDTADDWKGYGMPVMIGDPVKDAEQFKATSPLQQASHITTPLLLAHGGADRRVPVQHALQLRSALEANHAPLTWIFYKDEGHGWYKPENRVNFYEAVETFLAKNLAPAAGDSGSKGP